MQFSPIADRSFVHQLSKLSTSLGRYGHAQFHTFSHGNFLLFRRTRSLFKTLSNADALEPPPKKLSRLRILNSKKHSDTHLKVGGVGLVDVRAVD